MLLMCDVQAIEGVRVVWRAGSASRPTELELVDAGTRLGPPELAQSSPARIPPGTNCGGSYLRYCR